MYVHRCWIECVSMPRVISSSEQVAPSSPQTALGNGTLPLCHIPRIYRTNREAWAPPGYFGGRQNERRIIDWCFLFFVALVGLVKKRTKTLDVDIPNSDCSKTSWADVNGGSGNILCKVGLIMPTVAQHFVAALIRGEKAIKAGHMGRRPSEETHLDIQ